LIPPPPGSFRLLVFDWDGTVMDSISAIVECTFAALATIDGLEPPPRERVRHSIGMGLVETMDQFFPGGGPELHHRVLEAYREQWVTVFKDVFHPFPGVPELLSGLGEAGYLLAVATAKSRRGLVRDFDRSGLGVHFHASKTIDEAPSKPHPGMLLALFDELGVAPGEALMIGDTSFDLEMAANAGCASVGVLSGAQPRERLELHAPLACLEVVTELPGWLASQAALASAAPSAIP
jgi:phosphoglycolate phosphatase